MKLQCLDTSIDYNGITIDVLGQELQGVRYHSKTAHVLEMVFADNTIIHLPLKKPILFLNQRVDGLHYDHDTGLYEQDDDEIRPDDSERVLKDGIREQFGDMKLVSFEDRGVV